MTCFPQHLWHQPCCCRLCVCAEVPWKRAASLELPKSQEVSGEPCRGNAAPTPELPLAQTQAQHGCSPTGSAETAQRRCGFSSLGTDTALYLCTLTLAAVLRRKALGSGLQQEGEQPPRQPWDQMPPPSQGPCDLGGRGGCTCCSSCCFVSSKTHQMYGSESCCLGWLWHFPDKKKKSCK